MAFFSLKKPPAEEPRQERRRSIRTVNDEAEFRIYGITTPDDLVSARRFLALGMTHQQASETVLKWLTRTQMTR